MTSIDYSILFLSDLHIKDDNNTKNRLNAFYNKIDELENKIDFIIILGDLGNFNSYSYALIDGFLQKINEEKDDIRVKKPVILFIPGNHEFATEDGTHIQKLNSDYLRLAKKYMKSVDPESPFNCIYEQENLRFWKILPKYHTNEKYYKLNYINVLNKIGETEIKPDKLNIVLSHHNLTECTYNSKEHFYYGDIELELYKKNVSMIVTGDVHTIELIDKKLLNVETKIPNKSLIQLSCGTLNGTITDNINNSFIYIDLTIVNESSLSYIKDIKIKHFLFTKSTLDFNEIKYSESKIEKNTSLACNEILVEKDLIEAINIGILEEADEKNVMPSSIMLCLGLRYNTTLDITLDTTSHIKAKDYIEIPANEFILATTKEFINFPNDYVGHVTFIMRQFVNSGLLPICSMIIDPGFKGYFIFPLKNITNENIRIKVGTPILKLEITKLNKELSATYFDMPGVHEFEKQ